MTSVVQIALHAQNLEELQDAKHPSGRSVKEEIVENIATIGENLNLRRSAVVEVSSGVVATYVHNAVAPNLGTIAVAVGLETTASDTDKLNGLAKSLAMHIAAARPMVLHESEVDASVLERERNIAREKAQASGKPANIIEGMVSGRIRKFYEEIVLLNQTYVIDGKTSISDLLANISKEVGAPVIISSFARYELGEGIEAAETDFAAEVQAIAQK